MPTECSPALFEFALVEGRRVVARFDGGAITELHPVSLDSDLSDRRPTWWNAA
jgi:hypothetical protein